MPGLPGWRVQSGLRRGPPGAQALTSDAFVGDETDRRGIRSRGARRRRALCISVSGCATGEERYSIGMLLAERRRSPMIRVLLVDDHETVRDGLRLLVNAQSDMTVVGEAGDGQSALECVIATKPDIVVLDLTMPGMSGLSTAKALRATANVAVVALTRHDDDAYVQELTAAGAAGYVLKQSPSEELLRAIRVVASGGRHLDPALPASHDARDPRQRASTAPVTHRELEVLRLTALGYTNKEIASQLNIAVKTVEVHKTNAMRKLNLRGRTDVVRYAVMNDWLHET
jgi:two-component system, NarL family, response regulator NreC